MVRAAGLNAAFGDLRVMRRGADVASVGQRREAADIRFFPGVAVVAAAEEAHVVGREHGVGAAALLASAWPSSMLSISVMAATIRLLYFGSSQNRIRSASPILPALAGIAAAHRAVGLVVA